MSKRTWTITAAACAACVAFVGGSVSAHQSMPAAGSFFSECLTLMRGMDRRLAAIELNTRAPTLQPMFLAFPENGEPDCAESGATRNCVAAASRVCRQLGYANIQAASEYQAPRGRVLKWVACSNAPKNPETPYG